MTAERAAKTPACGQCGRRTASEAAPAWDWSRAWDEDGHGQLLCPDCTRRHARSIEGKLDSEWW